MRVKLDFHEPSTHWVALARVIEHNPDLPEDVILVVRKDGVELCEESENSGRVQIATADFPENSVMDLKGKLAVLEWVHEHFVTSRH